MTRSRRPFWLLFLLGPAVLFAIVYPIVRHLSRSSPTQNVVMGDLQMLITASDLLEAIGREDVAFDPRDETVRKARLPRGGRELTYRHVGSKIPVDVEAQVTVELDEVNAKATYADLAARLSAPDASVEPHEPPIVWGDEARYVALTRGGQLLGHAYLARKGTRVVFYQFVGVAFPDPTKLEAHLRPRLAAVERFDP